VIQVTQYQPCVAMVIETGLTQPNYFYEVQIRTPNQVLENGRKNT
jgi:hypothetical protein